MQNKYVVHSVQRCAFTVSGSNVIKWMGIFVVIIEFLIINCSMTISDDSLAPSISSSTSVSVALKSAIVWMNEITERESVVYIPGTRLAVVHLGHDPIYICDVVFMGVYYAYIRYVRRGQSSPGSLAGFDPVNIYFCFICILFILLV